MMLIYRPVKLLRDVLQQRGATPSIFVDLQLWEQVVRLLPDRRFLAAQAAGYFVYRKVRVYAKSLVLDVN